MTKEDKSLGWIRAEWPAPSNIRAGSTTRLGGVSKGSYYSFNIAAHVGDDMNDVGENRRRLRQELKLPAEPLWLQQIHSNRIIQNGKSADDLQADGAYANKTGRVCVVMTADCLPILLCNERGTEIAAIHVGWRGFSRNIIKNAISSFTSAPENLMAWMGPCICPVHYEIDVNVHDACLQILPGSVDAFTSSRPGHWYADLKKLARQQLTNMGIYQISESSFCTFADDSLFYSYRREAVCGRIATLIWMDS